MLSHDFILNVFNQYVDSHWENISLLTTNRNGPIPTRSICLLKQSLGNVSNLIFHEPNTDSPSTKPHNLSLLSIVTKLSLCNMSISLVKDALYNASS